MSSTVKRLQDMITQLEASEGGGVEAALAAGAPSAANSDQLEELLAKLKDMNAPGSPVKALPMPAPETNPTLLIPVARDTKAVSDDDDDTSVATEDTDQDPGRARTGRCSNERYIYLERKALQLMSDNKALALSLDTISRQKDLQIAELQAHLTQVVKELAERQKSIEVKAPLLKLRIEELRDQLTDLRISDARYAELKSMPADNLHVVDFVKMAVYEEASGLRKENERLRLAIASSRDAAARAEEDAARLRVEAARISAAMVDKEKDFQSVADGLQSRMERLASELEASMVRCEVLSAKGQMYDELKAKADRLQEDNQRLQVVEANFKRLDEQTRELQLMTRDKEHQHSMLLTDKAYLSQQVEFLLAAQQRLQSELQEREGKVVELQKAKQDLFDKLIKVEVLKNKEQESKLQRELAQLQSGTAASIERIRTETAEAYEREARLLRELRDQAQEDAARVKTTHQQLQAEYEQLQLNTADLQRKLESQIVELQSELKQKAFEVSHLNVVVGEKEGLLHRANMQIELLQDKLQVSMEQYRNIEADMRATAAAGLATPPSLAAPRMAAALPAPGALVAINSSANNSALLPCGRDALDQVLPELRAQAKTLQTEKEALCAQVKSLQAALKSSESTLQLAGQPHSFLLQQLQAAKAACQQAEMKAVAAAAALKVKEQETSSLAAERDALRVDLEGLLQQRGQLQGLKQLLLKTMGAPSPSGPAQINYAGSAATAGRSTARPPTTTIVGEGHV